MGDSEIIRTRIGEDKRMDCNIHTVVETHTAVPMIEQCLNIERCHCRDIQKETTKITVTES